MNIGFLARWRAWKHVLGLAVTAGAAWLVYRQVELEALGHVLADARPGWLVAAVAVFGLAGLCSAWRWHLILRLTGCASHAGATARYFWIGHCFNFFLFGPAAGDVARSVLYARRFQWPLPGVLASAPLDRLAGVAGLIVCMVLAGVVSAVQGAFGRQHLPWDAPWPWVLALLVGTVLLAAGAMFWRPQSGGFLARTWRAFGEGMERVLAHRELAARVLLAGCLVQVWLSVTVACCLIAVTNHDLPWGQMLWVFPVITISSSLPSVGGLGVREGASLAMLGLYGVSGSEAVAASLAVLGVFLCWVLVGAVMFWREARVPVRRPRLPRTISAVIPVLNEEAALPETVRRLRAIPEIQEVIVVDGGSRDGTVRVAEDLGCRVLQSPPGRGGQMRRGAAVATGNVILLTHADTWLPEEAGRAMLDTLRDAGVVGGGCWKEFRDPSWLMRGSRWRCAVRLFVSGRILGDQGIFVRREVLEKVGGVPDMPLMEEFELCRRLRRAGRLSLAGAVVSTSARRFRKHGVLRTYWLMAWITLRYRLGTPPGELLRHYERE